jgi:hypothetical protein
MNKIKLLSTLIALLLVNCTLSTGQVAIGNGTGGAGQPAAGAALEIDGTKGALLLPKVPTLPVSNLVAGMQVYLTTDNKVYTYHGISEGWVWDSVATAAVAAQAVHLSTGADSTGLANTVRVTGNQSITGTKTFVTEPQLATGKKNVIPAASPDGTVFATEAQTLATVNANKPTAVGSAASATEAEKYKEVRQIRFSGGLAAEVNFDGSEDIVVETYRYQNLGFHFVTEPAPATFVRMYDAVGDPLTTPTSGAMDGPTLSVMPSSDFMTTYQWEYRKVTGGEVAFQPATDAQGTGYDTKNFTPTYNVSLANWGLYEYRCVVSKVSETAI